MVSEKVNNNAKMGRARKVDFIKRLKTFYRFAILKINLYLRLCLSKKNSREGYAFLVVGAPRTGTRMLTRFFIWGGCSGNGEAKQVHEFCNPSAREKKIVWKTNIPYASSKTGNLKLIYKLLKKIGYTVKIVWAERDKESVIQSEMKRGYSREEAKKRIQFAQEFLKKFVQNKNHIRVNYEKFTEDKDYRKEIARECNIKHRELEDYKNQNKEHKNL